MKMDDILELYCQLSVKQRRMILLSIVLTACANETNRDRLEVITRDFEAAYRKAAADYDGEART